MLKKMTAGGTLTIVFLFAALQFLPYGHNHANPPVQAEPSWNSPETRALAERACFSCHSNQTVWPWYSNVAPASWLLERDVDKGRAQLNFSQWGGRQRGALQMARLIQAGEMPPWFYVIMHPEANLSAAEKQQLIDGLTATLGSGR